MNDVPDAFRRGVEEIKRKWEEDSQDAHKRALKALSESLDGLRVEIPMSLKAILDKGGAVRQTTVENPSRMEKPRIQIQSPSGYVDFPFHEVTNKAPTYRITVIMEPID